VYGLLIEERKARGRNSISGVVQNFSYFLSYIVRFSAPCSESWELLRNKRGLG